MLPIRKFKNDRNFTTNSGISDKLSAMKYLHYLPLLLMLAACDGGLWNNPYPVSDKGKSIYYSAFTERPKHLDPASAYSENEYIFLAQIYQPPLQYHFLKRPYTLVPQAASEMPTVRYLDKNSQPLPDDAPGDKVAFSVYEIHLRSGLNYQPHPAFARDAKGQLEYHALTSNDLRNIHSLNDFPHSGTREVKAADYAYQVKRLAHPTIHSPIAGLMVDYIVGLKEYIATLQLAKKRAPILSLISTTIHWKVCRQWTTELIVSRFTANIRSLLIGWR